MIKKIINDKIKYTAGIYKEIAKDIWVSTDGDILTTDNLNEKLELLNSSGSDDKNHSYVLVETVVFEFIERVHEHYNDIRQTIKTAHEKILKLERLTGVEYE